MHDINWKMLEGYLLFMGKVNATLERVYATYIKEKDANSFYKYINVVIEYGNWLVEVLPLFGYEHIMNTVIDINNLYASIQTKEEFETKFAICEGALNTLFNVTRELMAKKAKICICCGQKAYYMPLPYYYTIQQKEYKTPEFILETLSKEEYSCPYCQSSDRDRLIISFLRYLKLDKVLKGERLLQFAPSTAIEHWINANCPGIKYDSTDLYMEDVTFASDIQNMSLIDDETYDYFICSHVLEHVQDDKKAMRELYRILRQDGIGIFLVPIVLNISRIDEEWGLSEAENWKRFGQGDHCRTYTKQGLIERLQEVGFTVHPLGREFFGQEIFEESGLTDSSSLYVLTKQDVDLENFVSEKIGKRTTYKEPLVSVLLPTYNHRKYVAEAIESVLNQSYQNFEFLVADDGSTDGTVEEILKYENQIDQIHLYDINTGGKVFRDLIGYAKGKYIAMMHSDDKWSQDKLMMQVTYLENHPECAACFTGCKCFNDAGEDLGNEPFVMMNQRKEKWFRYFFEHCNCICHPSVLIHREIYSKLSDFNYLLMFRQLPDFWMWLHLVQQSEIHIIEKKLTFFRVHNEGRENTSSDTTENNYRLLVEEAYIWYNIFKKMDASYFVNTFRDILKKQDVKEEREVLCEKLFVLLNCRDNYCRQAAIYFLFDIYQIEGVSQLLTEQYGFTHQDIHKITGEYLMNI